LQQRESKQPWNPKSNLLPSCQDASLLLLGDATHGTQEFYQLRRDITQALEARVSAVVVEGDVGPLTLLNRHVLGQQGVSPTSVWDSNSDNPSSSFLWRNNVMLDFVEWLRDYNAQQTTTTNKIQLWGMDIYSLFTSMDLVVDYLERTASPRIQQEAHLCYSTLQTFRPNPQAYQRAIFARVVPSQQECVERVLQLVLQQGQSLSQAWLEALLNARAVVAGEAYFRLLGSTTDRHEASVTTWNLRDDAMLQMLQDIRKFIPSSMMIVVWAHNSHVGDMRAQYKRNGYRNLGQLCRQGFERVYSVGMTTHRGTVRASRNGGDGAHVMMLKPALESSHESVLHRLAIRQHQTILGLSFHGGFSAAQQLFHVPRLQRFVGITYTPEREVPAHYHICDLTEEFDYIIHVDRSTALLVDRVPVVMDANTTTPVTTDLLLLKSYRPTARELETR
jgi:protein-L-isoaspartate(D-aspartate) O-methyltransferase